MTRHTSICSAVLRLDRRLLELLLLAPHVPRVLLHDLLLAAETVPAGQHAFDSHAQSFLVPSLEDVLPIEELELVGWFLQVLDRRSRVLLRPRVHDGHKYSQLQA